MAAVFNHTTDPLPHVPPVQKSGIESTTDKATLRKAVNNDLTVTPHA